MCVTGENRSVINLWLDDYGLSSYPISQCKAIECIWNLWKVLDKYFVTYLSATAALYFKMLSFGMMLVIGSF